MTPPSELPKPAGTSPGRWARIRRLLRKILLAGIIFSLVQVLYVRFLPPLFTLTMLERKFDAYQAGKPTEMSRTWVDLEEVSPELIAAVLAGEDASFYRHMGFDFGAIRDAWRHNQKGKTVRGASTLSQQTARNLFLWQKRSWVRKGLEMYYTVLLELLVPKDRILELYLNVAEWGDRVFGVEAAAQRTFRKSAAKLNRVEAAALSASLPNPRKYPPDGSTRYQRRRQELILRRMGQVKVEGKARVDEEE